jgi:hypothetical protein
MALEQNSLARLLQERREAAGYSRETREDRGRELRDD